MEFYLDKFYNYQSMGQSWSVDFGRLPASEQAGALAAIRNPLAPQNLVLLNQLQSQYPSAFDKVSSLTALPAPDLSAGTASFPLGASVEMLLAFILEKIVETGNEVSAEARENAVVSNDRELDLADLQFAEKIKAAVANGAGQIASGVVAMGAGAGSFVQGFRSTKDSTAQSESMKRSTDSQLETQKYQETMERNVKQMKDEAQTKRSDAQRLNGYADEINSTGGLSPASRKNIDDDIKLKDDQILECMKKRESYDRAIVDAETKLKTGNLSEADRVKVQEELDGLRSRRDGFRAEINAEEIRLDADIKALQTVRSLDDHTTQIKAKTEKLEQLQQLGVRTQAQQKEMNVLEADIVRHTQSVTDDRAAIQVRVDKLNSEATQLDDAADALHTGAQRELQSRQKANATNDQAIALESDKNRNVTSTVSAGAQAVSAAAPAVGAGGTIVGGEADANAGHLAALADASKTSRQLDLAYADQLTQVADAAREFTQKQGDMENEVTKAVSGNIA